MWETTKLKLTVITIIFGMTFLFTSVIYAARWMEKLGRGVIAINEGEGKVYIGWRMLANDPDNIVFNLYRSTGGKRAVRLNKKPMTESTNWVDEGVDTSQANSYFVRSVINGREQTASASYTLPANVLVQQPYISVPLQVPADGTTPKGESYTYSANDCSVGDLDGDGEYEIILKWDPSNSKDNARSGYTGNVFLDAYKLDGTFMWRINLGKNIRAGAHYTQFMVYDLDGDGKSEVACKTAPGTIDGKGNNVILPGDDPNADYRNSSGYILSGPEYLTIFNGQTGAELTTTYYIPPRHSTNSLNPTSEEIKTIWGDSYGNRMDRFLACIAYLDGVSPSLVMCRGYYTRTVLAAWNWRNGKLTNVWTFNSNTPGNEEYAGQGNHNLSVGDIDNDGKDEIVYGSMCVDDNGTGLYTTGLGHGDAMHLSDMDPDRPGLEVWDVHETGNPVCGAGEFRDAKTGELIFGLPGTGDTGRGLALDIDPRYKGYEMWSSASDGIYTVNGARITASKPSVNFGVWWDGDLLREILDGPRIGKWNYSTNSTATLLSAYDYGCVSNNGTKANPCLSADILGDWREEVIWRTSDNRELRVFITTIPTTYRFRTLMHDPQYRLSIAWQNVGYNQPPHAGFYLGDGMSKPPHPNIVLVGNDGNSNKQSREILK